MTLKGKTIPPLQKVKDVQLTAIEIELKQIQERLPSAAGEENVKLHLRLKELREIAETLPDQKKNPIN